MISGEVASGKSSLLTAILGELTCARGSIAVAADIHTRGLGHVPQEPWIIVRTLHWRIGVLTWRRTARCVTTLCLGASSMKITTGTCCTLAHWTTTSAPCPVRTTLVHSSRSLFIGTGGDLVELGENGVNLSGGQKARSVARDL